MSEEFKKLGFEETVYNKTGEKCYQKKTRGRFVHEFNIFPDGELVINCYKSSGCITVSADEILANHNQFHNEAKDLIEKIKKIWEV
ncbi:hypothetical protein RYR35_001460 [Streptococcus iniae]|nr:hypothetical protein [Streptococcus iniae]